ncbi:probable G-protein coupled receptor 139 [Heptranchias perlo]|uniref:probable G-protein coupled receptor 139 n=1 Tax=Heptranchias perlo TaxID=212740 RepID=UPI003559DC72
MSHVSHKKAGRARIHTGSHCDNFYLEELSGVKGEVVQHKDKFSQAEKAGGGWKKRKARRPPRWRMEFHGEKEMVRHLELKTVNVVEGVGGEADDNPLNVSIGELIPASGPTIESSLLTEGEIMSLSFMIKFQILRALYDIQKIYYHILAAFGVPVNVVTIVILSRGKCGLSKCVTRCLVAMAAADLLVVIVDLILRQVPIAYWDEFRFMWHVGLCNIHAVLLYAVTDCSVWFTVTFTFDRFVAICCQKLKTKYCTKKTAAVVLGTVTVLSGLKNIFWYFLNTNEYWLSNTPWFCRVKPDVSRSLACAVIELFHSMLTPFISFLLIVLFNVLTVRHILVASRARRRIRGPSSGESSSDPEMQNRRKSIVVLFVISGNFILLWVLFMVCSILRRLDYLGYPVPLPTFVREIGFMLQLLSCCTNTFIYAVTQRKFREQLRNGVKYPLAMMVKLIR